MTVGIFGGSFNPIHIGHCILANYLVQEDIVDEVWFTVSPRNPFKHNYNPQYDHHRLNMARLAVSGVERLRVCDIEFNMPRPSYTINTLDRLSALHPDIRFRLIIGADNWPNFENWKNSMDILDRYGLLVYPRPDTPIDPATLPHNVYFVPAPVVEISSTFIRESLKKGHDMNFFLPAPVYQYIKDNKLYL